MGIDNSSSSNKIMLQTGTGGFPVHKDGLLPMINNSAQAPTRRIPPLFRLAPKTPAQIGSPVSPEKPNQAQAGGISTTMTATDLKALNPSWTGRNRSSQRSSMEQIEIVGNSLSNSGLLKKTDGQWGGVLTKNLSLAPGVVIPAGSKVGGSALPSVNDGRPLIQPGISGKTLSFTLPNGNSVTFRSTQDPPSGLGATSAEFFDKDQKSLGKSLFVSTAFLDVKNNALGFLTQGNAKNFRLSDFRSQANASEARRNETGDSAKGEYLAKDQLRALVQKVGLGAL